MQVAFIVFLFQAKMQFAEPRSIADVIRAKQNENTVERIPNLEELDYCLRKAKLDLEFLCKCKDDNVVPTFLNFRIGSNHQKYSSTYKQCKSHLLREKICQKKSTLRTRQKTFSSLIASLQNELTLIDFAHTTTLFFRINGKILKSKGLNFKVSIFKFYKPLHEKKSRTILKRLLVTFLGMSYLILKRSSLRKV